MRLRRLLPCCLLLCGCLDVEDIIGAPGDGQRPIEDIWTLEVDQPFDPSAVDSLVIGGLETSANFANRGDVQVVYADTDRIRVEIQRFTFAHSRAHAEADFARLSVWASSSSDPPVPPAQMLPHEACIDPAGEMPWPDGCHLRIYYDGQVQTSRSGADIRVTLPRTYTGLLGVTTEDNDVNDDYHDRARVCIEGLPGSAEIELGSGAAFVTLDENINPFEQCRPDQVADCDLQGWVPGCECLALTKVASGIGIVAHADHALDATVDMPEDLWAVYNLIIGDNDDCVASLDVGSGRVQPDPNLDGGRGSAFGALNQPPPPAQQGIGYSITQWTNGCRDVSWTASPGAFVGEGNGDDQDTIRRGNLGICAGCLREAGCDALMAER